MTPLRRHFIMGPKKIDEAIYYGNLGFEELVNFHKIATKEDKKEMEKILKAGDWLKFKALIERVTKARLT